MSKFVAFTCLLSCALMLAGCGSSHKPNGGRATVDPALQFARCMRAHGVSDFPDPSSARGGNFEFNSQVNPEDPSFRSAQRACQRYMPGKPGPGAMSASERAKAFSFAKCVRAHGASGFPDPTIGAANPNVTGRVLALRGMFFQVPPNFDPRAPAVRQAANACGLRLPPA